MVNNEFLKKLFSTIHSLQTVLHFSTVFANGLAYRNGPTFLNIEDDLVSLDALLELAHALDEAVVVCKEIDKRFDQDNL